MGETVLSPLVNDDDYMTMKPRKATDSADSQRRPLLSAEERTGTFVIKWDKAIFFR